MKKIKKNLVLEIIKTSRNQCREEEIKLHGKLIRHFHVKKSEKIYNRKKNKKIDI